jgi:hypothetical protein
MPGRPGRRARFAACDCLYSYRGALVTGTSLVPVRGSVTYSQPGLRVCTLVRIALAT